MRLFVAIDLDDDARSAIAAEQKRLAEALAQGSSLKWVRPEQLHLTLAFLGELDEARATAVIDRMDADIVEVDPFPIVFAGFGVFPPHGAPRVLWIGVAAGALDVIDVQRHVARRLSRVGVALDARPFHPHLTLARWRDRRLTDRRRVAAADGGADVARVEVSGVTLYQSRVSSSGPVHTAIVRARFGRGVRR